VIFCGIDPGIGGGIAFIGQQVSAHKMPETEADISELLMIDTVEPVFAVIEAVHSFPGQGVASTFKFGKNYGLLRGILIAAKIPFEQVSPKKWQREMGCLSKGDKTITKARAQQLFPKLKITHATADALLIALYAQRTYGVTSKEQSSSLFKDF
jgi:crossover junction endodeoxyribonuclease RuvC